MRGRKRRTNFSDTPTTDLNDTMSKLVVGKPMVMQLINSGKLPGAVQLGTRTWRIPKLSIATLLGVEVDQLWPPGEINQQRQRELDALAARFGKPKPTLAAPIAAEPITGAPA